MGLAASYAYALYPIFGQKKSQKPNSARFEKLRFFRRHEIFVFSSWNHVKKYVVVFFEICRSEIFPRILKELCHKIGHNADGGSAYYVVVLLSDSVQ